MRTRGISRAELNRIHTNIFERAFWAGYITVIPLLPVPMKWQRNLFPPNSEDATTWNNSYTSGVVYAESEKYTLD